MSDETVFDPSKIDLPAMLADLEKLKADVGAIMSAIGGFETDADGALKAAGLVGFASKVAALVAWVQKNAGEAV